MPHSQVAGTSLERAGEGPRSGAARSRSQIRVGRAGSMSALVALTTMFAVELVRSFPPLLTWSPSMASVGILAEVGLFVAPVLGAVIALVAVTRHEPRIILVAGALLLAVGRLVVQFGSGDVQAAAAGVALLGALAVLGLLSTIGLPLFGGGIVVGALVDAGLQALLGTRPLVRIESGWAAVLVAGTVVWFLWLVLARARRPMFVLGRGLSSAIPLTVIGPAVVLQAYVLASLGWVAHTLDTGWLAAAAVIAAAGVAGTAAAIYTARRPDGAWRWFVVGGALSLLALSVSHLAPGLWWAPIAILAQVGVGAGLTVAVARGVGTGSARGAAFGAGVGFTLLVCALSVLDGRGLLGVAIGPSTLPAAVGAGLVAVVLIGRRELVPRPHRVGRREVRSLATVFVLPALALLVGAPLLVTGGHVGAATTAELRVVTYNVALGHDSHGRLNLESVSAVLAQLDADVVALQEVPRGHLPSGGVDMLGWLQHRLGMPHLAFQPSAPGALHGNAVLSRRPIRSVDAVEFERNGTALGRGALAVEVDTPTGPVRIVTTHLPPGGTLGERADRVAAVLGLWDERVPTIVAGDLNAQPGSDVVGALVDAGLTPAWTDAADPGPTYPAGDPRARIDWILHSADLTVTRTEVVASLASDHLPVVAELGRVD